MSDPTANPPALRAAAPVLAVALAVLAAACGGSPAASTQERGAASFSRCMRSHGVAAYPDPSQPGLLPKRTLRELGVSNTQFQAAQGACIHLVPNGGAPTPAQVAQYRSTMLVYARCIRTHGVPNMPDPDSRGHLDIGPGSGVDVNSPKFLAAFHTCKKDLHP